MRMTTTRLLTAALLVGVAACKDKAALARNDSLTGQLSEQSRLATQLQAQKDSLTRVVLDADAFIGQMDSAITTVKGLPKNKRKASDPLADQVLARKDMHDRVTALVTRAKATANQLAELQRKQSETEAANTDLRQKNEAQAAKIEEDAQLVADLGSTIERQRQEITTLSARLDSIGLEMKAVATRHYTAYYVIGTEKELMDKGVIVKEGGTRLIFVRAGRTLVPSRVLDPTAFTTIDQRENKVIAVPDTSRRYRIISRQSLDAADVPWRDATSFKGNLKIVNPDDFWAPSRFLILVKL
jgi:septal ring factor EnvC (AmiA/AmiB activator)